MRIEETKNNYMTTQPDVIESELIQIINAYFKKISKEDLDADTVNKICKLISTKVKGEIYQKENIPILSKEINIESSNTESILMDKGVPVGKVSIELNNVKYLIKNYGSSIIDYNDECIKVYIFINNEDKVNISISNNTSIDISIKLDIYK